MYRDIGGWRPSFINVCLVQFQVVHIPCFGRSRFINDIGTRSYSHSHPLTAIKSNPDPNTYSSLPRMQRSASPSVRSIHGGRKRSPARSCSRTRSPPPVTEHLIASTRTSSEQISGRALMLSPPSPSPRSLQLTAGNIGHSGRISSMMPVQNPATSFHQGLRSPVNEILSKVAVAEVSGKALMGQKFRTSWPTRGGERGEFWVSTATENWECLSSTGGGSSIRHDIDRFDRGTEATITDVDRCIDMVTLPAGSTQIVISGANASCPDSPSNASGGKEIEDEFARADGRHQRARIHEDFEIPEETCISTGVKGYLNGGKRALSGK